MQVGAGCSRGSSRPSLKGEAGVFCPSRGEAGVSWSQAPCRDGVQVGWGWQILGAYDQVLNPPVTPACPQPPTGPGQVHTGSGLELPMGSTRTATAVATV